MLLCTTERAWCTQKQQARSYCQFRRLVCCCGHDTDCISLTASHECPSIFHAVLGHELIAGQEVGSGPALQQLLQEPPELAHADARPISLLQAAVQPVLQLSHITVLTLSHCLPEVVIAAEDGVLGIAHPPRWHRPACRTHIMNPLWHSWVTAAMQVDPEALKSITAVLSMGPVGCSLHL